MIGVGALVSGAGIYCLSRVPQHGTYAPDLLSGLVVMSLGMGSVVVALTTAANPVVPGDKAGLAARLLKASQQVGSALGLAILSAIAVTRTKDLLAAHASRIDALAAGYQRGRLAGGIFMLADRRPADQEHPRRRPPMLVSSDDATPEPLTNP